MNFGGLFERVQDAGFAPGCCHAQVPGPGLTTRGLGIDGTRAAALDWVRLWLEDKQANGELLPNASEVLVSTLDVSENALQVA